MALDPLIVLEGEFKLGADAVSAVSYKDEVSSVLIRRRRDTIEIPATFGTGRKTKRAGAVDDELVINVIVDPAVSSLMNALWAQIDDPDGELYFEAVFREGAVAPGNPEYSGRCVITGSEIGGASGQLAQFSVTLPIVTAIAKATT
jgi:hypothetical protein